MDACIYAYAMMENYQTWYAQAVDRNSNAYVGGFNVYLAGAMLTPADRLASLLPGARSGTLAYYDESPGCTVGLCGVRRTGQRP